MLIFPPIAAPAGPKFKLKVRGRLETDAQAMAIEADTAAAAFETARSLDVTAIEEPIMTWGDREQAVALDFDRPDDAPPLRDVDIKPLMAPNAPKPVFAWVTHGGGLRLIFFAVDGVSAPTLAGLWLMLAPLGPLQGWRLEVKTDTRHPAGLRDGAACGQVFRFEPSATISLRPDAGAVSEEEIAAWLAANGLTMGRHGGDLCPWSCGPGSGNPPVSVTHQGVRCFRCNRSASWAELVRGVNGAVHELYGAARALVHLGHQLHVIHAFHPIVPRELIAPAWAHILRVVHAGHLATADDDERKDREKRIAAAASGAFDLARSSSGGWIDAETLRPRKVTARYTLPHLPSALWSPMIDKADDTGPLEGFTPIHPIGANEVIGPGVLAPRGTVMVRRPRFPGDPPAVDVSRRPSQQEVEQAWAIIEVALPGISRDYHAAIIIVMLVAQRGIGTPPILCATGQTGAAKTAQVHLGAGALGSKAAQIVLGSTDDTTRKVGLALEEGAGAVCVDEVGRVEGLYLKLAPVLSANSELAYRPKYSNERRTSMRCAVFLLGSTLPEAIVRSPELARRSVGYRLTGAEKRWSLVDPNTGAKLDLSEARRVDWLRSALDTVTAAMWWAVHDLGPAGDWRQLLFGTHGAVPLSHLDLVDGDGTARRQAILGLYEAYRGAKPNQLSTAKACQGWLIADEGSAAGEHLSVLVELDAEKPRFTAATSDLERQNLAPVLGFANPQLQLLVRRRSGQTLVKFVEVGVPRGKGTLRGDLPPPTQPPAAPSGNDQVTVTL